MQDFETHVELSFAIDRFELEQSGKVGWARLGVEVGGLPEGRAGEFGGVKGCGGC